MFSWWASLQADVENDGSNRSVLQSFPDAVGREVVLSVVRQLASSHLSIPASRAGSQHLRSPLDSEKEVLWTMEVICYGLSLPLTEQEAVKNCVNIYCEWLSALTIPKHTIPTPLLMDPNFYVQKILRHLINLFQPRTLPRMQGMNMQETTTQVMLCHRVLRTVQTVASESIVMTRPTWETLLKFLLAVNDTILAPPLEPGALSMVPIPDSLAEQLCERLLSVLFEIWLLACGRCFPSPTLWKTFRDMCATWRHHAATVEQWNRINKVLTSRLLKILYGPEFPALVIADEESHIIPAELDNEGIAQTWFRFMHLLGNPIDLCRPKVISHTPKFQSAAVSYQPPLESHQFTCLQALPQIFLKAMRGVSVVIDAFLGLSTQQTPDPNTRSPTAPPEETPPPGRKISRKEQFSVKPAKDKIITSGHAPPLVSQASTSASTMSFCVEDATDGRGTPTPRRSQCNSILHLFGAWLLEAALTGCKSRKILPPPRRRSLAVAACTNTTNYAFGKAYKRHHSITIPEAARTAHLGDLRSVSLQDPFSASVAANPLFDMSEFPDNYEAGRAEACGMLCRIFSSRKSDEEIQHAYLARFYIAFCQGVRVDEALSGQVLSSVLYNSINLLRIDLKGVQVLIPDIITALQIVLPEKEIRFQSPVSPHQLRRASIHLLLSMLCLPHHFKNLPIQDLMTGKDMTIEDQLGRSEAVTFLFLKPKLVDLMITAVQCETDSYNTRMLLGAMNLCVLDSAMCEEMEARQCEMEEQDNILHEEDEEEGTGSSGDADGAKRESDIDEKRTSSGSRTSSHGSVTGRSDSAWIIFVRCCHLVCQRLMSAWSTDYTVALAALELLAGLAKVKIKILDSLECKRAVKWICDHIVYQCSRPSMYHSRDLHSIIVAAFHCLTVWLVEHGDLLKDKECLQCVLEVVELGISGTKSQRKASVAPVFKHDKTLKPASKRVKDAAEGLLACLLNHVGSFPNPCGPSSVGSLLDEQSLLRYGADSTGFSSPRQPTFRYFVLENTTLMAVLERPVTESNGGILPTVTTIIRGPTGRHVWTMQLRHCSKKDKTDTPPRLSYPKRPEPDDNVGTHHEITSRHYPEAVDKILLTQADQSIPSLEDIETEALRSDHQKLKDLIEEQTEYEKFVCETAREEIERGGYPNMSTECKPPNPCHEFGSARLILSHLGYLSVDSIKETPNSAIPPTVVALDDCITPFASDLTLLDAIPSRTYDTAFIFYVKAGQSNADDILQNVTDRANVQPQFLEFLGSLGWPVDVHQHAGWTGNIATSWKITFAENGDNSAERTQEGAEETAEPSLDSHGGSLYNGQSQVLYHADVMSEIAFVVPSTRHAAAGGRRHSTGVDLEDPTTKPAPTLTNKATKSLPLGMRNLTLDIPPETAPPSTTPPQVSPMNSLDRQRKSLQRKGLPLGQEIKVLIVWLESFDDREAFPLKDLLEELTTGLESTGPGGNSTTSQVKSLTEPSIFLMFIHPLKSGLFRIHMHGRPTQAIPLVDGMVVSRRTLGTLVRQTAINACHRKRMETDSYSPPHVKRRQKIQDMANKYRSRLSVPEFYTTLFADCSR